MAAQAFINRLCPKELILNVPEKCLLLIEEINRVSKIEEPYMVSKYAVLKNSRILKQNNRKETVLDKSNGQIIVGNEENWTGSENEDENQNRYFDEASGNLEKIEELEKQTLENPKREDLYLALVQRYLASKIKDPQKLALTALSEALGTVAHLFLEISINLIQSKNSVLQAKTPF